MTDQVSTLSEIINQMPEEFQFRFTALRVCAQMLIDDVRAELHDTRDLAAEETELIQLALIIYSLDRLLRAGTRAARSATGTFECFGFQGFQVGSARFTSQSAETSRGELLADSLRDTIAGSLLSECIISSQSMRELVTRMIREFISLHA
jgi:hypothetical protein